VTLKHMRNLRSLHDALKHYRSVLLRPPPSQEEVQAARQVPAHIPPLLPRNLCPLICWNKKVPEGSYSYPRNVGT
jgi:hypothetical protein